jgi:GxxExxY protein
MYRFFEVLPGLLTWLTFALMFLLSWLTPAFVAVFIILFDVYWLLKSIYLSLHLRHTFKKMKATLKVDWLARLREENAAEWREIWHLIILPFYREPYAVIRESVESLIRANYPKDRFILILAAEERGGEEALATANKLKQEFGDKFFRFEITVHPAGLPGEIPGKGSNETWAAKEALRLIIDPLIKQSQQSDSEHSDVFVDSDRVGHSDVFVDSDRKHKGISEHSDVFVDSDRKHKGISEHSDVFVDSDRKHKGISEHSDVFVDSDRLSYDKILVSVFDVDTQVFPEYFGRLTYVFLNAPNRLRAIYQPIPLFTNNVYQAPALARVVSFSTTFWQMMQQSRPERLTSFSSQSIPLPAVLDIGFWQTDIVSEDSRVFWQGYLRYNGDFRVEPLFYPVSMDANAAPTFWQTMKNLYRQQRRWGWGAENVAYIMCGKQSSRDKQSEKSESHPNSPKTRRPEIVEKELSYKLTGIFFEVQKKLGRFARERQYSDVLALELEKRGLRFKHEQALEVGGRKSNFVDFVVEEKIAVELKAKPFITKEDYYQLQRYLQSSNLELGLIVNFAQPVLKPKRVLNVGLYVPKERSEHSDAFVDSDRVNKNSSEHSDAFVDSDRVNKNSSEHSHAFADSHRVEHSDVFVDSDRNKNGSEHSDAFVDSDRLNKERSEHSDVFVDSDRVGHSDAFVDSDRVKDSHRREGFLYNSRIPLRKRLYWGFNVIEGYHSWATNSLMIFALGWLPLVLGGEDFGVTLLSYNLPQITRFIISLSMVGIASSAIIGILILPPRPPGFRKWHYLLYFFQWLLLPLTLIVFGALPAIDAQTRLMLGGRFRLGFWVTPKGRYPKNAKESREGGEEVPAEEDIKLGER